MYVQIIPQSKFHTNMYAALVLFSFNQEEDLGNEEDENDPGNITELATDLIGDDEIEIENNDVNELSDKEKSDQYTEACKKTLAKVNNLPFPFLNVFILTFFQ
jgi:hypothetical protein